MGDSLALDNRRFQCWRIDRNSEKSNEYRGTRIETSGGPPNQPMRDVYARSAAEMDGAMADFKSALEEEMAKFDALTVSP